MLTGSPGAPAEETNDEFFFSQSRKPSKASLAMFAVSNSYITVRSLARVSSLCQNIEELR